MGIDPTLGQFTELARHLRQEAEEQARRHGRALGAAIPDAMAARSLCPRDHTRSPVRDERPLDERVAQPTLSW